MIEYVFVELGEGYSGDYDPADPGDRELLRLDVLDNGEEIESFCTALPVALTPDERQRALDMVAQFAADRPVSHRTVTEVFSYMDPSWLETGQVPAAILAVFNLEVV